MTMQLTQPSLIAVATGIIGSAWCSGCIASMSIAGIPAALSIPSHGANVWQEIFNRGIATMPKLAVSVALFYGYAAYDAYVNSSEQRTAWAGYLTAAALVVAIAPFTILIMDGTNQLLQGAAAGTKTLNAEQVAGLLQKWSVLNAIRSVFPVAGAIVGAVTFIKTAL